MIFEKTMTFSFENVAVIQFKVSVVFGFEKDNRRRIWYLETFFFNALIGLCNLRVGSTLNMGGMERFGIVYNKYSWFI